MRYEEVAKDICGEFWEFSDPEGGYGIGLVISFLEGVPPFLQDMAKHLDVPESNLVNSLERLMKSGIFSKGFNAKNDQELLGNGYNIPKKFIAKNWLKIHAYRNAWCFIAGIASDKINRNFPKR